MGRVEKTVFISYRRTNVPWALAIFQSLNHHGYDVFFDYNGIASGDFEKVILENIKSRAHFVVLLTPSALERCGDPTDWLRREIEPALSVQRNIVPLMLEGFNFSTPAIASQLTGTLALLKNYNALSVPAEYFDEAMNRLRTKYLNVPLDAVLHPASASAQKAAKGEQFAAGSAPVVQQQELTAQQWFERGFDAIGPDDKLRYYSEAIRLKPDYALAFYNRGVARKAKGDLDGAVQDYSEAIRLKPDDADAFNNRGVARKAKGDLDGAVQDYNEVIRLKPDDADAFYNRGIARQAKGDLDGAVQDYSEAIRLKPDYAAAFYNRGIARSDKGDLDGAVQDYSEAIRLKPDDTAAFYNRGVARQAKGDLDGAVQDYSEAIRLKPDYAYAFINRGIARKAKGDLDGAVQDEKTARGLRTQTQ
jgi:tetratricopeptide (TPR) repeat protein